MDQLQRIEHALETLIQQVCGETSTIEEPFPGSETGGWITKRYGNSPQERLTLAMYLWTLDRNLNSKMALGGRPAPEEMEDDIFGHILSLRADVIALRRELADLRGALGK